MAFNYSLAWIIWGTLCFCNGVDNNEVIYRSLGLENSAYWIILVSCLGRHPVGTWEVFVLGKCWMVRNEVDRRAMFKIVPLAPIQILWSCVNKSSGTTWERVVNNGLNTCGIKTGEGKPWWILLRSHLHLLILSAWFLDTLSWQWDARMVHCFSGTPLA